MLHSKQKENACMRQFLTVIAAVYTICLINSVIAREIDTRGVPIKAEETTVDDESSLQSSKLNTVHYSPFSVNQFKDSGLFAKKPEHDKLETALSKMLDIYLNKGIGAAEDYAERHGITLRNSLVLTELNLHKGYLTDSIDQDVLKQYGVEIESRSKNFIIVWIPIEEMENFASALDAVSLLHRPYKPIQEIITEGFELVGGAGFHDEDILGDGVRIGVFDMGYALSTQARNAGELPEFTARNFTGEDFNEGNVHGTACAEIIYDFASEADLYLVKLWNSAHFENALEYASDNEIDIVSMSLGWRVPLGDYFRGEDRMSVLVNDAYEDGLFFVQSAGNSADAHYRDDFDDQRQDDHYHRFADGIVVNNFGVAPGRNFEFDRGTLLSVSLVWDDFPNTDQDFDLELVQLIDDEWELVDRSNNRQDGNDIPVEEIDFIVENSGEFGVRVLRFDADNGMDFTLISYPNDIGYHTSAGSITIPSIAEGCFAVGAIYYRNWERDNPGAEDFSSRGPTYDGRIKPDIAAPDGVSTYAYGQMDIRFFGTSAACPHAAGAAALVLSNDLNMNNANIREYLQDNAIDIGNEGPDNTFGYGKLSIEPGDPGEPPTGDSIYYDDGDPTTLFAVENYWSKVTFTVHGDGFELGGVRFMPYNPAPNPNAPCHVRIYSESDNHQLDELIWETEIEELDRWNGNDIDANWIWLDIPENDRPVFNNMDNFTVMYGPAPGGDYDPDNMEEGDGWWNVTDEGTQVGRSSYYEGDDPAINHDDWVEIDSDLFIRAFRPPEVEERPEISVEPESLNFGDVHRGESEDRSLTIHNPGNADLIVSSVIVEGPFWEYFDLNFREQVLIEPDASWDLIVTFSPLEVGAVIATLVISSNDPENDEISIDMQGVGLGDAVIRV
ncbi:S8 family serine peptidase, partial [bacterium]|nr:S8 family serine peptidase [bacterium]